MVGYGVVTDVFGMKSAVEAMAVYLWRGCLWHTHLLSRIRALHLSLCVSACVSGLVFIDTQRGVTEC